MGRFKDWFLRRGKKPSPNSEVEDDAMSIEDRHESLQAYIVIGSNKESGNFVATNFTEGNEEKMAELIFLLFSGSLMDECVKSLASACSSDEQGTAILNQAAVFLKLHQTAQQNSRPTSGPVVDPCDVFRGSDKNDYKG